MHMIYNPLSTAVDCGALTNPANGNVSNTAGTTFRKTANYSCNTGYNLVGDSNRTCRATRMWSGSAPTCQGMLLASFPGSCVWAEPGNEARYVVSTMQPPYIHVYMIYFSFQQLWTVVL